MSGGAANNGAPARLTFEAAARAMSGTLLQPGARGPSFAGAATDNREVSPGQLFFALAGERVDGFAFAGAAAAAGAAGVVVARGRGVPDGCADVAVIAVDDPRRALGDLARFVRASFNGKVVAVTGSNGKTTTKELCAAALGPLGPGMRTPGNRNTDVGLPLTILSATGTEAWWVLELAMRARGEIAYLAEIARPHIGVITNVAGAHLETLGSIEEVARAKGELFAALGAGTFAILPVDDPLIAAQAAHLPPQQRLTFGARGTVRILDFVPAGPNGSVVRYAVGDTPVVVHLPLGGAHNARNGAAALAVARAAGVAPVAAAAAMQQVTLPPHRSAAITVAGRTILDDCYNANPASMSAALNALPDAASSGVHGVHSFAILGDMRELGAGADEMHRALGREAGAKLAGLAALGDHAAAILDGAKAAGLPGARAQRAETPEAAAALVAGWSAPGDWILVKASRGMRLERAVEALSSVLGSAPNAGPPTGPPTGPPGRSV
jgi:UDP-N-acetylmuramoyl-tripeptide--D-alanyl-D-alanine ligase